MQKTAYEMRISDWSSDVCSSDLAFGEMGYAFDLDRAQIEPFANLAHVRVRSDAFGETGGDARLSGGKAATDVTFSTLGLRAATTFDLGKAEDRKNVV